MFGQEVCIVGKQYVLLIVYDYSRFTWVLCLLTKDCIFSEFEKQIKFVKKKLDKRLVG